MGLDSLGEQADAPVPGLTHRYPDKALFLVIDTCPVYCRFCTRSYAVGIDTEEVEKISLKGNKDRWAQAFAYIESRPELEDIVISGGDAYNLRAIGFEIGTRLLKMENIRRIDLRCVLGHAVQSAYGRGLVFCTDRSSCTGSFHGQRGGFSYALQ